MSKHQMEYGEFYDSADGPLFSHMEQRFGSKYRGWLNECERRKQAVSEMSGLLAWL